MAELKYGPVYHDHKVFLKNAEKREGFRRAYEDQEEKDGLICEMLAASFKSGLTKRRLRN